jgi:hypothetical protein
VLPPVSLFLTAPHQARGLFEKFGREEELALCFFSLGAVQRESDPFAAINCFTKVCRKALFWLSFC